MNHLICIKTCNNTSLLRRITESLVVLVNKSDYKNMVYLIVVDDSSITSVINKNLIYLKSLDSKKIVKYHFATKINSPKEVVGYILSTLGKDSISSLDIFTKNQNLNKNDLNKDFTNKIGGAEPTSLFQQLACLVIASKHNLDLKHTICSFYDDDVILKTLKKENNKVKTVFFDYLSLREKSFGNDDIILSYGKYLHHHGNPWVTIERDLASICHILESYYVLTNSQETSDLRIYKNNKYLLLSNSTLYKQLDTIIESVLRRSSIISPILPEHYDLFDKKNLVYDEGNYSTLASVIKRFPVPNFGFQAGFIKALLMLTFPDLDNRILIEPGVIHIRPGSQKNRDYLKSFTLKSLYTNESSMLGLSMRKVVSDDPVVFSKRFSELLKSEIKAKDLKRAFGSSPKRDDKKEITIKDSFKRIDIISERYQRFMGGKQKKAIRELLKINNFEVYEGYLEMMQLLAKERLEQYFNLYKSWEKITRLDWKQFPKEPIN